MVPSAARRRPDGLAVAAALLAVALAATSAALSLFWAFGGHALVDTMGGSTERWARTRSAIGVTALTGWAVLKLAVAALAVLATGLLTKRAVSGWLRVAAWVAAVQMALYGGLLTLGGLLAVSSFVDAPGGADHHAITWHALLWDPWTCLWGLALGLALWRTRSVKPAVLGPQLGDVPARVVTYDPRS